MAHITHELTSEKRMHFSSNAWRSLQQLNTTFYNDVRNGASRSYQLLGDVDDNPTMLLQWTFFFSSHFSLSQWMNNSRFPFNFYLFMYSSSFPNLGKLFIFFFPLIYFSLFIYSNLFTSYSLFMFIM